MDKTNEQITYERWSKQVTDEERDRLQYHAQVIYPNMIAGLRKVAKKLGYCLAVHGSQKRDLDLLAFPWTEAAVDAEILARAIWSAIPHGFAEFPKHDDKPHGRKAWSFYFLTDAPGLLYVDLSVAPRIP